jgi:2-oxoglutarate ferredoxin oxidoreductase subunit gamma
MRREVFMAGTGGQGVLLIGQILTQAALEAGLEVSWFPVYTPEVRGGSTTCTIIIADGRVGSPISGLPRVVVVMDQVAANAHAAKTRPGGIVLTNSSLVSQVDRDDVRVVAIPATARAAELGSDQVANMIMLGAYVELTGAVTLAALEQALRVVLPERRHNLLPLNMQALQLGAGLARAGA